MSSRTSLLAAVIMLAAALMAAAAMAAEGTVATIRRLGPQFLDNSVGVTGADGATSLVLPGGDSLWVFGDTVEGPFESIRTLDLSPLRSNTAAIVPPQDPRQGIRRFRFLSEEGGKRPRQLILFASDEIPAKTRLWAVHGVCQGEHLYLFYHRISLLDGVDVFENFRLEGMGVARSSRQVDQLSFERLTAPDGSREFWKGNQPTFGVWVERDDDYVYLWGSLMTGMFLARVSPERIGDLAGYEYLVEAPTVADPHVSPRWSKEFSPTAVLFDNVPNEMSASYNAHLGQHIAIHALGREGQIVMRTAPHRWGPWSEPKLLYEVHRQDDADLVYAAKEHPELAAEDGRRIYVTFVNSSNYVPQMIEATLH